MEALKEKIDSLTTCDRAHDCVHEHEILYRYLQDKNKDVQDMTLFVVNSHLEKYMQCDNSCECVYFIMKKTHELGEASTDYDLKTSEIFEVFYILQKYINYLLLIVLARKRSLPCVAKLKL